MVRVHAQDPRADSCPASTRERCRHTLVAETLVWLPPAGPNDRRADVVDVPAGRYDDGLPRSVGGQPVLRGSEALAQAQRDHGHLVVPRRRLGHAVLGGHPPARCSRRARSRGRTSCGGPTFADVAGTIDGTLGGAITFRFAMDGLVTGPIVASVHVHDPRAQRMLPGSRTCDGMMVVDRIVWAGDSATDPRFLSA